jgi:ribosome biogenesis GTPase
MQAFGLWHVSLAELADAYREFRPYLSACRFANCRHCGEPDCAIAAAVERGEVSARRLALYRRLAEELLHPKHRDVRPAAGKQC